ncbi:MAG: ScyD/ScyE family protein [Balneolaceae bacterium]|nr:ScyD/ScyE family protein [Balneolaceae bacterium]
MAPKVLLSGESYPPDTRPFSGRESVLNMHGFVSPLFGLATAPNGDILVADAGAGVSTLDGTTDIPLTGITDMSPIGRNSMWTIRGLTGSPGDSTGQALFRSSKGTSRMVANLFQFERENNPDGEQLIDSNPFDVQSAGGNAAVVADAGGNDLLRVNNRGQVEVLAIFPKELVSTQNVKDIIGCADIPENQRPPVCGIPPEIPAQPVPTSIAVGPEGDYYVGELKGFPAPLNESNIWRVAPDASWAMCGTAGEIYCSKVFDGGFTSVIDMAFGPDGYLYVAEFDDKSWFAAENQAGVGGTINKCNVETTSCSEVATGIPLLTAITFGTDGSLWAVKNALVPGMAEVFKVQ